MSEPALQADAARAAAQRKAAAPDPDVEGPKVDRANSVQAQSLTSDPIVEALMDERAPLEAISSEALGRVLRLTALETSSRGAIEAVQARLLDTSREYDIAYKRFAKVLKDAGEEAENQQFWTDIAVGIAIGVVVGMTFEAIPIILAVDAAAGAAAAGLKGVAKKGVRAGVKEGVKAAPKEALGEGVEALGGYLAKAGVEVAGKSIDPGGLRPEILQMGIWKSLVSLSRAAPKIGGHSAEQALLTSNAEYAIGEIKAHSGGGRGDLSPEDALELAIAVEKSGVAARRIDAKLTLAEAKVTALERAAKVESTYRADQMERDIWVLWMGSLAKDSNVLDLDEIEDHIGPKGLGLVDFGWYTSDEEENAAIAKARRQRAGIVKRRDAQLAVGAAQPVAEVGAAASGDKPSSDESPDNQEISDEDTAEREDAP